MRAIVCRKLGPLSALRLEDVPEPDLGPGQIRIGIKAAGINFPDILTVEGVYQHKPPLPFIVGFEIAGEVLEMADDVRSCLLYTSPRPRDATLSRMPSSA